MNCTQNVPEDYEDNKAISRTTLAKAFGQKFIKQAWNCTNVPTFKRAYAKQKQASSIIHPMSFCRDPQGYEYRQSSSFQMFDYTYPKCQIGHKRRPYLLVNIKAWNWIFFLLLSVHMLSKTKHRP